MPDSDGPTNSGRKLKIAQIAPLMESVPPRLYGGTERIVSYLSEELSRLGHDVTLFASGNSVSSGRLVSCAPLALRLCSGIRDPNPYYMLMLDRVRDRPKSSTSCIFTSTNFISRCSVQLRTAQSRPFMADRIPLI